MEPIQKTIVVGALGLAVAAGAPAVAGAGTLGLDFSPGNVGEIADRGMDFTLGYAFQDVTATSVTALGTWDSGVSGPISIGLWNSARTLLASTTVTTAATPVGSAPWLFSAIKPVALTPGDTYYVGSIGPANYAFEVNPVTIAPQISYLHNAFAVRGLSFPSEQSSSGVEHGFFGGNVELSTAVPEPASLAILGAGLVGFGAVRRLRRT